MTVTEEEGREFCRRVLVAFPRNQDHRFNGSKGAGGVNPGAACAAR